MLLFLGGIPTSARSMQISSTSVILLAGKLQPSYAKLARVARESGAVVSFDTGWGPFRNWSRNNSS